jgi:CheY-like chemotaxis protein
MSATKALIIDDNPSNLKVLVNLLKLESVEAVTLSDPLQLEAMLSGLDKLDVIFLDLEMPDLDGYEVLDLLRESRFVKVPVVAYTVHISEMNAMRAKGFHSFLGKPLNAEEFPRQLARILKNEPVWSLPR